MARQTTQNREKFVYGVRGRYSGRFLPETRKVVAHDEAGALIVARGALKMYCPTVLEVMNRTEQACGIYLEPKDYEGSTSLKARVIVI